MEKHSPAGPSESPSSGAGPSSEVENTSGTGVSEEPTSTTENSNQPVNQELSAAAASPSRNHQKAKFWKNLKELSRNNQDPMKQWVYISTTKSHPVIDSCLCGGTNFKCLYHIKNVETGELAQLAGNHIDTINQENVNLGSVLFTAQAMFEGTGTRSVSGHLRAVGRNDNTLRFQVNQHANLLLAKHRTQLTAMYLGGIPFHHDDKLNQDFLIAKAECDKASSMMIGKEYTLWVRLYVDDEAPGHANLILKAEVIKAKLKN